MTDTDAEFSNSPPKDSTLIPIAAFKAFHQNYIGVPKSGEMKITFVVPVDDIHDAMNVAQEREEILWIQVSKLRFGGTALQQLAETVAAQEAEREAARNGNPATTTPATPVKKGKRIRPGELDWES